MAIWMERRNEFAIFINVLLSVRKVFQEFYHVCSVHAPYRRTRYICTICGVCLQVCPISKHPWYLHTYPSYPPQIIQRYHKCHKNQVDQYSTQLRLKVRPGIEVEPGCLEISNIFMYYALEISVQFYFLYLLVLYHMICSKDGREMQDESAQSSLSFKLVIQSQTELRVAHFS